MKHMTSGNEQPGRRAVVTGIASIAGIAGAATVASSVSLGGSATAESTSGNRASASADPSKRSGGSSSARMPVAFLPHGGGPWPFTDIGMDAKEKSGLTDYLVSVAKLPKTEPKALLVVSAHWEADVPTVMSSAAPPLLFDYYGFPPETYRLTWPAPGEPALAARVRSLLGAAGIASAADDSRGFDHGTFVPLKLTYPDAHLPTVQLSLKTGLDAAEHLAIGRALAPLRDEGVFIVGSGMSFHNMRAFRDPRAGSVALQFDAWLAQTTTADATTRDAGLARWADAPGARTCHPREEHLLPLMVIAGAAGADQGRTAFSGEVLGKRCSGFHFG
jgi:aromatic ring-opening dioxygenase catalytic subunit (LigB family)